MLRLFNNPDATRETRNRDDHGRDRNPKNHGELIEARQHLNDDTKKRDRDNDENANSTLCDITVITKGIGD